MKDLSYNIFLKLLHILILQKKHVIIISAVVFIIGLIYSILAPYQYTSESSVLPPKQSGSGMNLSAIMQSIGGFGGMGSFSGLSQNNLSSVYGEVLTSNSVLTFIYDTLDLQNQYYFKRLPKEKALKILKSSINVLISKSGILFVKVKFQTNILPSKNEKKLSAKLSSDIANTAIRGLDYVIRNRNNSVSGKTRDFIGKEIVAYSLLLDSIQNSLEIFRKENNVLELEEQTKAIVLQANTIAVELAKAEVELNLGKKLYSDNSQNLNILRDNYNTLLNQYNKIQSGGITQNDEFSIPLKDFPTLLRDYSNLIRDQKLYEQILIYLRTNYYQESIQEKRDVPQIDVLDWANIPNERSAPSYKQLLFVFILLDLVIILIYLFFKSKKLQIDN